ncbi:MAG: efflux transporter outer membrane subunit [Pseudomonadota bacterium]
MRAVAMWFHGLGREVSRFTAAHRRAMLTSLGMRKHMVAMTTKRSRDRTRAATHEQFSLQRNIVLLACALFLNGCALVAVDTKPPMPTVISDAYAALDPDNSASAAPISVSGIDNPALVDLIDRALANNFSLAAAEARLVQAEALAAEARAALFPSISAGGNYTQIESLDGVVSSGASAGNGQISWAPDFSGRRRATAGAARRDAKASAGDYLVSRLQLAHAVGDAFADAGEARRNLALLDTQLNAARALRQLAAARFARGAGPAADLLQQDDVLATLEAQRPTIETLVALAESRLDVLTGAAPDRQDQGPDDVPAFDNANIDVGVPLSLIARRPDLVAARETLIAADYRAAEALANFFPDVVLSATASGPSFQIGPGFQSAQTVIFALVAQISQSLFEGGARVAQRKRARAAFDEASANFSQAWLDAIASVNDNLIREERQRERVALLAARTKTANANFKAAQTNYAYGASDFTNVLIAQQSYLTAQSDLLAATRDALQFRTDLLEALGALPDGRPIVLAVDNTALNRSEE